jgi:hypothetical protein
MNLRAHVYIYASTTKHMHTQTCKPSSANIHRLCTHTLAHTVTYTYAPIHTHTYTYICTYNHTHTHTRRPRYPYTNSKTYLQMRQCRNVRLTHTCSPITPRPATHMPYVLVAPVTASVGLTLSDPAVFRCAGQHCGPQQTSVQVRTVPRGEGPPPPQFSHCLCWVVRRGMASHVRPVNLPPTTPYRINFSISKRHKMRNDRLSFQIFF